MSAGTRTVTVDLLTRVEGEGALRLRVEGGRVSSAELRIFEPPRFFEALLRGRHFTEAPDLTARICGICPVAHQITACKAMEDACGVRVGGQLRALRRLLYCGEWIESHALHVALLHAPDFLSLDDVAQVAQRDPALVEQGLSIKKTGNAIVRLVGGREIHPVNVRVGGFHRVPGEAELRSLQAPLAEALRAALALVRRVGRFEFPRFERDIESVALREPGGYPIDEGRIVSSRGLDVPAREFDAQFAEEQVEWSHALHCRIRARGLYEVGPLARFNLNFDRLSPLAREAAAEAGLAAPCKHPFRSIVVRAVETVFACEEALRLIAEYQRPDRPAIEVEPREAAGSACTEAPRGLLHHRYRLGKGGLIEEAAIVPPTSQNQLCIEEDLRAFAQERLSLSDDQLRAECERAIRNYDPCISCATHFLRLERR